MKLYDITQEVFTSCVYPGDRSPERYLVSDMNQGALYNVTEFAMCAHNGTHVDAPRHFFREGKTVEELDPALFFGSCTVKTFSEIITTEDLLSLAGLGIQRLLCRGNCVLSLEAAKLLRELGIRLIGVEPQSISKEEETMAVHLAVLEAEIVVLEGLRLDDVPDGEYFLSAAPLKLGGSDGAPCRVFLLDEKK